MNMWMTFLELIRALMNMWMTFLELIRAVFGRPLDGDLSTRCNYARGLGTCQMGCWEEPACITNEPVEGWPSKRGLVGRIKWVIRGE